MKWMTTREFARLIENHYPVNDVKVRSWCEEGFIPEEYAKRTRSPQDRGRWHIAVKGLEPILRDCLAFSEKEMAEIRLLLKQIPGFL